MRIDRSKPITGIPCFASVTWDLTEPKASEYESIAPNPHAV